jgi:hypothetical protein
MDLFGNSLELVELEINDVKNVADDAANDDQHDFPFNITSYGADYTVDGLVKRLRDGAFEIPDFQRLYVWPIKQASRFVESLLLGLPVPGIFVFRQENQRHIIVDGQQRLLTLRFFYDGTFNNAPFILQDVRSPWEGKAYKDLSTEDRLRLDDSIIHTTVFRQDYPQESRRSVYEVFERINTGGMKLSPQEIRVCVNAGPFSKLLRKLNEIPEWRKIYGPKSVRLKDEELVLRFLALLYRRASYKRPMKGFLDDFTEAFGSLPNNTDEEFTRAFEITIKSVIECLGERAFRPQSALNAAVFDAVMLGMAERLRKGPIVNKEELRKQYEDLLSDSEFQDAYVRATADEDRVTLRINKAVSAFENVA